MAIKISFLAPPYYGKTTGVKLIKDHFSAQTIKMAQPLYELQNYFYTTINKPLEKEMQDGELLLFFGNKIRKEQPEFLHIRFLERMKELENKTNLILNDDCRPHSYEFLKSLGFYFIKINGFPRQRVDHVPVNTKSSVEWHNDIPYDFTVDNLGTLKEYRKNLLSLIDRIIEFEEEKGKVYIKDKREFYDVIRKEN